MKCLNCGKEVEKIIVTNEGIFCENCIENEPDYYEIYYETDEFREIPIEEEEEKE